MRTESRKPDRRIPILFIVACLFVFLEPLPAQGAGDGTGRSGSSASMSAAVAGDDFPVRRIVLFSSGVGYFQRTGTVTGNAGIELAFEASDINDLLKSLVVRDLSGGTVTGVTYSSREPVSRTLKTFSIDLSENPALAEILKQGRGKEVEADIGRTVRGRIVGIETKPSVPLPLSDDGDGMITEETFLNLLTASGITRINLQDLVSIRFVDPAVQRELDEALALIASSHDSGRKTVSIGFAGTGRRDIFAGYVRETPVWKTSYRLVLSAGRAPFLQGWAIVENTSGEDWKDVALDLIAGQPLSFVMDLYEPIFNRRPDVAYALQPQVGPQVYEGDLSAAPQTAMPSPAPSAATAPRAMKDASRAGGMVSESEENMNFADDAAPDVRSESVGEFYRYSIASPVSLARQQSAMLPIVGADVKGTRYSIYNESVLEKNPLNAMKLENTTGAPLRGGPVTIYEDGVYAGDAQIDTIEAGGRRLLSFSIDLETEVVPRSKSHPEAITSIKISRGLIYSSRLYRQEKTYEILNRGSRSRIVLIEHPLRPDWTLVAPAKPAEITRDTYRFEVPVDPARGGKAELSVVEERTVRQSAALSNLDRNTVLFYLNQSVISARVKAALERLTALQNDHAAAQQRRKDAETRISDIEKEQSRIRSNMDSLDRDSALYKRYVTTLNSQEDTLLTLRDELTRARADEAAKKAAVDAHISGLEVE